MTSRIFIGILLAVSQVLPLSKKRVKETVSTRTPKTAVSEPLIADNQQFLALYGVTDNHGKFKNTYQNYFHVKVPATDLLFPFAQTYSDWTKDENGGEFSNPATYRAAISINRGPWMQLTWGGKKRGKCPFHEVIVNDPLPVYVKTGDTIILRTEITVPPQGKWGLGAQARSGDPDPNWTEGGTDSDSDVLLSNHANFQPDCGTFTHTAQGVFGQPVGNPAFHSAAIIGDSISPYVLTAVSSIGNAAPLAYFGQPGDTAGNYWRNGPVRQKLLRGYDVLLDQYGVNDLQTMQPFDELKISSMNTWAAFKAAGGKHLIVFTLTPLAHSTDKFITEANQIAADEPPVRAQWNDFLRGLTKKDVGMNLTVIDTAALFESEKNNSIWKPAAAGGSLTDDGVHPNGVGYALIEKELGPKIRTAVQQD